MAEELKHPTKCRECGGSALSWFAHKENKSGVQDGRLCMHDVRGIFVLGCDDCHATVAVVSADRIADHLNARAQPPSQGGVAVAWRVTGRDGLTVTAQYPEWAEADCLLTITPLYTHPADQVEDDLTMVKVSRELLERAVGNGLGSSIKAMGELRALLAKL